MNINSTELTIIISFLLLVVSSLRILYLRRKYRKQIMVRKARGNYIYFYRGKYEIFNLPFVKIGRTRNMKQRMRSAKTSNPFGIWLLAVVRVKSDVYAERTIHKKFERFRLSKRNEWFWYLPVCFFMWCVMDYKLTKEYKEVI